MNEVQTMEGFDIRHLFTASLSYKSDLEPVVPPGGRDGTLIGNGDGELEGQDLSGKVRWSMYSGNCAYVFVQAGVEPTPGQHLCTVSPGGVIETHDGAQVWFDAKGFGLRGFDESQPNVWVLTMSIQFKTTDERYGWLNSTLGTVTSEFDDSVGKAIWRTYIPITDKEDSGLTTS
ncbi:MAG: hypothetical protein ACE5M4_07550 [Anaerolineales bacterium]